MSLRETVARTLAWRTAEASSNGGMTTIEQEDFWELILTPRLRDHYRDLAEEIIDIVREGTP